METHNVTKRLRTLLKNTPNMSAKLGTIGPNKELVPPLTHDKSRDDESVPQRIIGDDVH